MSFWGTLRKVLTFGLAVTSEKPPPIPSPTIRTHDIAVNGIKAKAIDFAVADAGPLLLLWRATPVLSGIIPDPSNAVILIFTGTDAQAIREVAGLKAF